MTSTDQPRAGTWTTESDQERPHLSDPNRVEDAQVVPASGTRRRVGSLPDQERLSEQAREIAERICDPGPRLRAAIFPDVEKEALAREVLSLARQLTEAEGVVRVFIITSHNAGDHPDALATCRYPPCAVLRPALEALDTGGSEG